MKKPVIASVDDHERLSYAAIDEGVYYLTPWVAPDGLSSKWIFYGKMAGEVYAPVTKAVCSGYLKKAGLNQRILAEEPFVVFTGIHIVELRIRIKSALNLEGIKVSNMLEHIRC